MISATGAHRICALDHAEVIERVARYSRTDGREIADWFDRWADHVLGVVPLSVERARRAVARACDVEVVPLPDSTGTVPE